MLFAIHATFKPDIEARRLAVHDEFSDHLRQRVLRVRLASALHDDAARRTGVLILLEAEDRATVERFVASSPYTKAGLYDRVEIDQAEVEAGSLG